MKLWVSQVTFAGQELLADDVLHAFARQHGEETWYESHVYPVILFGFQYISIHLFCLGFISITILLGISQPYCMTKSETFLEGFDGFPNDWRPWSKAQWVGGSI